MKISYTYRGNKVELTESTVHLIQSGPTLQLRESKYTDGNSRVFTVDIEADELLSVAKACLSRLSSIAEINYKVFVNAGDRYLPV